MPQSLPDLHTLLRVSLDYLEQDLYPTLSGPKRYHTRVAINALRIVQRELRDGPALEQADVAQITALLGEVPADVSPHAALATKIEEGAIALDDAELVSCLRDSLQRALKVNNPGWLKDTAS